MSLTGIGIVGKLWIISLKILLDTIFCKMIGIKKF